MAEKIESLTELIAEEIEILVTQPSMMADDVEMIGKETELIVTTVLSKGKTAGKEAAETGGNGMTALQLFRQGGYRSIRLIRQIRLSLKERTA